MNEQRKIIYKQRMEIINDFEIDNLIFDMRDSYVDDFIDENLGDIAELDEKKRSLIKNKLKSDLNIDLSFSSIKKIENIQIDDIKSEIKKLSSTNINLKKTKYSEEIFSLAEKSLLLQVLDKSWKEHLLSLDHLRQGISLRAYGQKDPLNEYKQEAFLMFEEMMRQIRFNVSKIISFIEIKTNVNENGVQKNIDKPNVERPRIPRNSICPLCQSGKKYKHCCGKL